jgi:hypothetical protein
VNYLSILVARTSLFGLIGNIETIMNLSEILVTINCRT